MKLHESSWLFTINCATWTALIGLQFGLPLNFNSDSSRRFDTPVTPAGYAFSIWGIIFLLQGIGSFVVWVPSATWAHAHVRSIGLLWPLGWLLENIWTVIQWSQQRYYPGQEQPAAYWIAAVILVSSHVVFALALARAVRALQQLVASGGSRGAMVGATLLYVVSSGLNAGWLGLASSLGILQVAVSHGATYSQLVTPGLVILPLAALTAVVQPWVRVIPHETPQGSTDSADPLLSKAHSSSTQALAQHDSSPGLASPMQLPHGKGSTGSGAETGSAAGVHAAHNVQYGTSSGGGSLSSSARMLHAALPAVIACAAYCVALGWGLAGVLGASRPVRPDSVRSEVHALLWLLPVVAAAGLGGRIWHASRRAHVHCR